MKTPVQELIEMIQEGRTKQEILEQAKILLSCEKEEIELAWMDGNEKGWKMETDWPQHATEYYNHKFKSSK